ncbi:hypothetical protein LJC46_04575 [Desulfovibrio sp. OttesenSCG-928-G15]|nr:hypothetical protein [Desulfovibrio sp. OttesenSCG-928-G15]
MEDAHQHQYYAPLLADIAVSRAPVHIKRMAGDLLTIQGQTQDSISREARRLEALLAHSRALFTLYFGGRAGHRPLARLLYDKESLIRRAFGEEFPTFVTAIYGENPERLYHEAAVSLLAGGREEAAENALQKALSINPEFAPSLRLQQEQGLQPGL